MPFWIMAKEKLNIYFDFDRFDLNDNAIIKITLSRKLLKNNCKIILNRKKRDDIKLPNFYFYYNSAKIGVQLPTDLA